MRTHSAKWSLGRVFDRQIGATKRGDRYADCRIRTGFAFDRHICYATGDREWSSGESRVKARQPPVKSVQKTDSLEPHRCARHTATMLFALNLRFSINDRSPAVNFSAYAPIIYSGNILRVIND